jgi:flavorubredoxin
MYMEPDHSASIKAFRDAYPNAVIIGNAQIIDMIGNFFPEMKPGKYQIVENGETFSTGRHQLTFVFAPMVHWPEVMMTYESTDKVLFSADGFGRFGALDVEQEWTEEARRYYIGIVGKFGSYVQAVLKKALELDIQIICPLHGPVLKENLGKYIALYDRWSGYKPEKEGICLCYTSVYGQTKKAVSILKERLLERGAPEVEVYDLARCDMPKAVAAAFKYNKLVLATTTYNGGIFPYMNTFIHCLTERNFQNRTVALIENGSWAPQAAACMRANLQGLKNINFTKNTVTILSAINGNTQLNIDNLAEELTLEYHPCNIIPGTMEQSALFNIGYA